jgi:predicted enzyme related to lactoylglutathione lyase
MEGSASQRPGASQRAETTRLVHLAFDANDVGSLSRFWAAALGWEVRHEDGDEAVVAPAGFGYPGPGAVPIVFVPVPERKEVKSRVHLDLATSSAEHQAELVGRLTGLGGKHIDIGQADVPWAVMADPEGNEFCVLEPRDEYSGTGPVAAICTDCGDPAALARFWSQSAGWTVTYQEDGFAGLRSPAGTGPFLEFLRNPDAKQVKNRLHPDLAPEKSDDRDAELARLLAAGATRVDVGQGEATWAVLADPEGNEFCLLTPR